MKRINGGCFYPVPPVESALINIFPRNPPPVFDFSEFNSLTKMCFCEKRRTLKNVFTRPAIQKQLELNYKMHCSFQRIPASTLPFPKYLEGILVKSGLADYPAKYLRPTDMERLLEAFHGEGIFFAKVTSDSVR